MPASLFPSLLERLRGTPARLEERLRGLDAETLLRREGETWSIQETAGHLLTVEKPRHGRLDDYDAGLPVLRAADMENRATHAPHTAVAASARSSRPSGPRA